MPNPYLTGALRGADTALGRRADSRAEQRRLEEEQRAQAEQRQAARTWQLQQVLAQLGGDSSGGSVEDLLGRVSSGAAERNSVAETIRSLELLSKYGSGDLSSPEGRAALMVSAGSQREEADARTELLQGREDTMFGFELANQEHQAAARLPAEEALAFTRASNAANLAAAGRANAPDTPEEIKERALRMRLLEAQVERAEGAGGSIRPSNLRNPLVIAAGQQAEQSVLESAYNSVRRKDDPEFRFLELQGDVRQLVLGRLPSEQRAQVESDIEEQQFAAMDRELTTLEELANGKPDVDNDSPVAIPEGHEELFARVAAMQGAEVSAVEESFRKRVRSGMDPLDILAGMQEVVEVSEAAQPELAIPAAAQPEPAQYDTILGEIEGRGGAAISGALGATAEALGKTRVPPPSRGLIRRR